jgi:hypothetical protein
LAEALEIETLSEQAIETLKKVRAYLARIIHEG